MKQLLFLFLLPCLAWAQYPSNGNQKITLGEQTTADGLIWRGVASDTTLTAKSDTAAYFVLDTVNINLYTYKASATGRKWRQLGADTASIAYVNTYGTQTVNGAKTFTSEVTATRFNPTANTATGTGMFAPTSTSLGFSTNGTNKLTLNSSGNFSIGNTNDTYKLDVSGSGRFSSTIISTNGGILLQGSVANSAVVGLITEGVWPWRKLIDTETSQNSYGEFIDGDVFYAKRINYADRNIAISGVGTNIYTLNLSTGAVTITNLAGTGDRAVLADVNGVLSAPVSSISTKENVQTLKYGLNEILQINPVSFDYIKKDKWGDERKLGFIVEDMFPIVPEVTGTMNNGDMYLDMVKLIPILTKAIQEQNLLIKALEQKILNLENK